MIVNKRISLSLPVILSAVLLFLASSIVMAEQIVVSGADSIWNLELTPVSPDVIDSTDAPEENLITEAFVSHADSIWTTGLEKTEWNQKWSFAIITDLHIGFDIPDYDGYGYNDASSGQDYYLSKRLEAVIRRINELKDDYNIKFVAVLGDISDTAEYSELLKARDILNNLNDPDGDGDLSDGIPYIPLIGNHDVWPYTQKEGIDPDERGKENHTTISLRADGDEYFEKIFWCSPYVLWLPWPNQETYDECLERNTNLKNIKEVFGNTFKRQEEMEEYRCDSIFLQNYVFSYRGINFISLDTNKTDREKEPGSVMAPFFNNLPSTTDWYNENFKKFKEKPILLFSHHPSRQWKLNLPSEIYFSFAGHVHHRNQDNNDKIWEEVWGSIITEAVLEEYENVIRIVQVKDIENPTKEDIDYSTIKGIPEEIAPDEIKRPDPYIIYTPSNPAPNETITFIAKNELRGKDIKSCKWDFGDGTTDNSGKCEVTHSYSPFIFWRYTAKATITYTDGTQRIAQKSLWVRPKIKLKVPEFILPSLLIDETVNVAETPQNTAASVSLFKEIGSQKLPIGIINVHFEKVGEE